VNRLTHRTLDPHSKIPEFKVSACRIQKVQQPPEWWLERAAGGNGSKPDGRERK
jgi:hypothetical protein